MGLPWAGSFGIPECLGLSTTMRLFAKLCPLWKLTCCWRIGVGAGAKFYRRRGISCFGFFVRQFERFGVWVLRIGRHRRVWGVFVLRAIS